MYELEIGKDRKSYPVWDQIGDFYISYIFCLGKSEFFSLKTSMDSWLYQFIITCVPTLL